MTSSELKYNVEQGGHEPYFFSHKTMRFFGDKMSNYGVRGPYQLVNNMGETVPVMELYRRHPVKNRLFSSAYFNAVTWKREFIKEA